MRRALALIVLILACDSGGSIIVPDPWIPEGPYHLNAEVDIQAPGFVVHALFNTDVEFVSGNGAPKLLSFDPGFLPPSQVLTREGDAWEARLMVQVAVGVTVPVEVRFMEAEPPLCVVRSEIDTNGPCVLVEG